MDKNVKEIKFSYKSTIEKAVNELLEYRGKGESVFGSFNGHKLYSDNVTMNGAYQEIMGKDKEEFDKSQDEWFKRTEEESKEQKSKIPELSKMWADKGREVLSEDKWEYWDKIVPVHLDDLYHGLDLRYTLDIISSLNENDFDMAREKFDEQNQSGVLRSLILSMVEEFCEKGNEFVKFIEG